MGKTIKQIAEELGVSKQAVQKRIAREPLHTCTQPYISIIGGTKYIDVVGENLVKQAFSEQQPTTMGMDKPTTVDTLICTLQHELEIKNEQIKALNDRLAETTVALVVAQQTAQTAQALHAGTIKQQLGSGADPAEPEAPQMKKGWKFWKK